MRNILISPIKACIWEIQTSTAYYILCSSYAVNNSSPNAMELHFFDTTNTNNPFCFSPSHASMILEFFLSTPPDADIFVCCDSGESRSAAIAAALKLYQGESDYSIWHSKEYHPNTLVYDICCDTFGISGIDK